MEYTIVVTERKEAYCKERIMSDVHIIMNVHSNKVNNMIDDGWAPIGGITIVTVNGCWGEVCQAMIREK